MRIAIVAPPWYEVPPVAYGGIESVCYDLTQGLVARGHDVTLIASGAKHVDAGFVPTFDEPPSGLGTPAACVHELTHAVKAARAIDRLEPEVVHDHSAAGALTARARRSPTVVTVHNGTSSIWERFFTALDGNVFLVALSEAERRACPTLPWIAVAHNGIRVDSYPYRETKGSFILFLGRTSADKGLDLAIEAARDAQVPLVIAAKCVEPEERAFFAERVEPELGRGIRWLGEVGERAKRRLLARARALIMPVRWDEPFGLVAIEALACGTPVVALANGALPEIVRDRVTGFLCERPADLVGALGELDRIDPAACRRDAETRFTADRMVERYEAVYETAVGRTSRPMLATAS